MNPNSDKLVRRTAMVASVTASYFLLTADYGPEPNVLDPNLLTYMKSRFARLFVVGIFSYAVHYIKNAILSAERSVKEFIFGPSKGIQENETKKLASNAREKHP